MANMYIRWPATYVSGTITPVQPNPALLNATVTQGTAAALSGAWPIKVTDGINYAAIKAASTAPQAADPALVVAISPNSPITVSNPSVGSTGAAVPASANYIGASKSGVLTGLVLDSSSNLLVSLATALPAGTNTIGSINNISGTISLPTGAATSANQTNGSQKTQVVNSAGAVVTATTIGPLTGLDVNVIKAAVDPGNDVFATTISGTRYNQVEISFQSAPGASLITNTFSGGGAVSYANGHALYSTSTAATAQAKGVSVGIVTYRPANEIYAYFTAAFTTPTSSASHQRIGIYDTNNGFFLGFEGTSFGITVRNATADTTTPQASFNGDLLNGSAGSKFTRNGTPEAINLNYSNLFRIRFGWLGSASILFDVFSPDGIWVNFHTIKQPNTSLNPSIQNPNLPITLDVSKTASDGTDLIMATACWAGGTSSSYTKITDALTDNSLAGLTRSVITGVTTGGGGGYVNVKVNPSGALVADVTGTVAATQSGTWNINNISGTISLPTGAATSANQTTLGSQTTKINDGTNTAAVKAASTAAVATDPALVVAISPNNNLPTTRVGSTSANAPVYNNYSSTSITTAAYTELVASTTSTTNAIDIFDSSGQAMILATGGAGSETIVAYVPPGGASYQVNIPAGTRVAYKALTANATSGYLLIDFWS